MNHACKTKAFLRKLINTCIPFHNHAHFSGIELCHGYRLAKPAENRTGLLSNASHPATPPKGQLPAGRDGRPGSKSTQTGSAGIERRQRAAWRSRPRRRGSSSQCSRRRALLIPAPPHARGHAARNRPSTIAACRLVRVDTSKCMTLAAVLLCRCRNSAHLRSIHAYSIVKIHQS